MNELHLRALFLKTDGTTSGPRSFTGQIGKLLGSEELETMPIVEFEKIDADFPEMSGDVEADLSTDQQQLLAFLKLICYGTIGSPVFWKIGALCHSRWLTLGIRILALYVRTAEP